MKYRRSAVRQYCGGVRLPQMGTAELEHGDTAALFFMNFKHLFYWEVAS
jgi:hypothetical protein